MGDAPAALPFGLVLAGGLARRMGGRDKTLMVLHGRTRLLDTLRERMQPQCRGLAISAAGDPARFNDFGVPVLADAPGPSRGPLAGVLTGLDHASAVEQAEWLLTVPGDTPFVPVDLTLRLARAALEARRPVVRATCGDRLHALVALWSCTLRDALHDALMTRDQRKVTAFQADVGVVDVAWPALPHDPFFNVNTPEDLEAARAISADLRGC